ncbi:MAG: dihydroorotase [Methanobacteriota archaeon]
MDLTIEGNAYINGSFQRCCLGIQQGKIAAVKKNLKAEKHIDVGNKLILPAGVDLHVHFRDPGLTHKEDFFTGSRAAAFGGITYVGDMPNTKPPTTTLVALKNKKKCASKKSVIDFGIYAGVTDANRKNLSRLALHCSGFKIYLGSTTHSVQLTGSYLPEVFRVLAKTKKVTLIHAEQEQCLQQHTLVERSLLDHMQAHPVFCEETAITSILRHAKKIPVRAHICHLSSTKGVELVKKRPANVTVGVTPHHLLLESEAVQSRYTWYKVNPPIRTNADRESLWKSVNTRVIDVVESDHAPHTLKEKEMDFDKAPSGVPGVETMYPLLLALVKQDKLSFQRLISLICEKPAEILRIPKGTLAVGRDADFIVVDFKNMSMIHGASLHSKSLWTPFEGWPAVFPDSVYLRGESLIDDQELLVKPGFGRLREAADV